MRSKIAFSFGVLFMLVTVAMVVLHDSVLHGEQGVVVTGVISFVLALIASSFGIVWDDDLIVET